MPSATAFALVLLALSLAGLLISLYFTLVAYDLMAPDARVVPQVCRMDEETCATVIDTDYGRVFGAPNAVYGLVWYMAVGGLAVQVIATGQLPACGLVILAAAGVVLFSVYLAWALVQKLDTHCPLCFTSHAINGAILVAAIGACGA